ncbi:MAG: VTT domain-containing protein [Pseudomonadota bacterium]
MSLLPRFLRRLDDTATRTVLVSIGLFALVISVFLIGKSGAVINLDVMQGAIDQLASGPWGLPALIGLFVVCAFVGIPQFVLIGMAVVAFGPAVGFAYAWLATLVSGTVTFWTGRLAGEEAIRRYGGNFANRMSAFIGRNAFFASAIVRNVPTGPFLLVNMAFGVSHARFSHYLGGMAVGVLPKLFLVTFAGQSVLSALGGRPLLAIAAAIAAVGLWIVLALYARKRVKADHQNIPTPPPQEH